MKLEDINELTRIAYDKTAAKYHQHFKNEVEQKEYDRDILDSFSVLLPQDALICDAGCGPSGQIGKYVFDKGHRVIGIDLSPKCIEIASQYHPDIEFQTMDMMHTAFDNESFDGILSFYSIIYTPKTFVDQLFAEFNRILKPNGKLLLVVKKGIEEGIIDNEWYEGNPVQFTHFVEAEIEGYLSRNHFRLDSMDVRKPYDFEFDVDRIYTIASKIE